MYRRVLNKKIWFQFGRYSNGVRMDWVREVEELVLAPSFWGSPFVFFDSRSTETSYVAFGARPKGTPLVPGELVPEELLNRSQGPG